MKAIRDRAGGGLTNYDPAPKKPENDAGKGDMLDAIRNFKKGGLRPVTEKEKNQGVERPQDNDTILGRLQEALDSFHDMVQGSESEEEADDTFDDSDWDTDND